MAVLTLWVGSAFAEKKRVVVLDFEGPNAEKFRSEVVKLVKKSHKVLKTATWNKNAEELDAAKVTEKNVKKIAKKMNVDGVITGKVEKKRDEYVIKLKLRSGATGQVVGSTVTAKAEGPRLEGPAQKAIKDDLVTAIDELESNSGEGGGDEAVADSPKKGDGEKVDEEKPKKSKKDEENAESSESSTETKSDDGEEKPKKRRRSDDDGEEKPRKRRASSEDDGENNEVDASSDDAPEEPADKELNLSPSRRAVDAVVGLSFTARNLKFTYAADLGDPPPGYKQSLPVGGALLDVTVFPLSFNHKKKPTIYSGIGISLLYDQVLKINSQKRYSDAMNNPQIANLSTTESRFSLGGVFRYPLGTNAKAPVVGGSLTYTKQKFSVAQQLPNMEPTDIPNVAYTMFSPGVFVRFPVIPKVTLNLDAAFHAITNTGDIQTRTQYGAATVSGYSIVLGGDYLIKPNIFARAAFRYQNIGFEFKGDPMSQTNTRDTDPEQDVTGASDSYVGGAVTVGYLF